MKPSDYYITTEENKKVQAEMSAQLTELLNLTAGVNYSYDTIAKRCKPLVELYNRACFMRDKVGVRDTPRQQRDTIERKPITLDEYNERIDNLRTFIESAPTQLPSGSKLDQLVQWAEILAKYCASIALQARDLRDNYEVKLINDKEE